MPVAEHGVLDLFSWNSTLDGPVALNGQWEFYWDQLLTPEDFAAANNAQKMSGFLNFPGFWKGYDLNGQSLPREGQATFRLRILPSPENRQLTLRFLSIPAAYQIWANGTLVATSGVVGRSDQTETPDRSLVLTKITNDGSPIDLVMQISNHYFHLGGVQTPIMLAAPGSLEQAHFLTWSWGLLFVGCMLSMALYHFILYILRNKDISTLYFGLYCVVSTVLFVMIDYSDWLARSYLPDADFVTISKIVLICFASSASIIYRFYRSLYTKEVPRFLIYLCDIRGLIFIFIVLFLPGRIIYTLLSG
ncbi:MAG: hypothetical protein JEY79_12285 [Pseudodesulfovibrio sp.]|nr:hypothetical protein [Pseudodesulfovibrio sp.]